MNVNILFRTAALLAIILSLAASRAMKNVTHPVVMEDMKFKPDSLEIKVGDSVEWTNNDERDHNVAAKDGTFKSDNLGSGRTFKHTFKKAGKFPYSCTLHPRMKGMVIVADP